jgi:hypothetical protein
VVRRDRRRHTGRVTEKAQGDGGPDGAAHVDDLFEPLDFDLIGLADWEGSRWVADFRGEFGRPISMVMLGHFAGQLVTMVSTAPRTRWDRMNAGRPNDDENAGLRTFARDSLFHLLNGARPRDLGRVQSSEYFPRTWYFAEREALSLALWEPADLTLANRHLEARVFRFAHAWVGVAADEDRYLAVTAYGPASFDVHLSGVDGLAYGWDFTKPFRFATYAANVPRPKRAAERLISAKAVTDDHRRVLLVDLPPKHRSVTVGKHRYRIGPAGQQPEPG